MQSHAAPPAAQAWNYFHNEQRCLQSHETRTELASVIVPTKA
jgi:hypothetical protein